MEPTTYVPSLNWNKVYGNRSGTIYQSDEEKCWFIDFAGKIARFDYRNILKLKKAIYNIDIEALLLSNDNSGDLEIIFICACDHCYVLSLMEIISFKDLLEGTFVMLELNHILQDRLHRVVA